MSYGIDDTFDPTGEPELDDFTPIPSGRYVVRIEEAKGEHHERSGGAQAVLKLKIVDGEFRNRVIFGRHWMRHTSTGATEIGRKQLASAYRAAGLGKARVSALGGRVMEAYVKFVPAKGEWDAKNEVSGYYPAKGGGSGPPPSGRQSPPPPTDEDLPF